MTDDRYGGRGQDDRVPSPWPTGNRPADDRARHDDRAAVDARAAQDTRAMGDGRPPRDAPDPAWYEPAGSIAPEEDDDLDRAFGHDTASVGRRTAGQRVRASTLVAVFVVVVAVAVGATLWVLIGNVQTGIGGIFPAPGTASSRFTEQVRQVDGVTDTQDLGTTKTSFASHDVLVLVSTEPGTVASGQRDLVERISALARETSGNGVHVYALVRFGDVRVGVSPSLDLSRDRLRLVTELAGTAGVRNVTCDWQRGTEGSAIRDRRDGMRVVVDTTATGPDLAALQQTVQDRTTAVLQGAEVLVRTPTPA